LNADRAPQLKASVIRLSGIQTKMIRDVLLPALQLRFPNRGFRTEDAGNGIGVFPASHREVGDLSIFDDGDEATLFIGQITHLHIDSDAEDTEPETRITNDVVKFLDELFSDRILIWKSLTRGGDGAMPIESASLFSGIDANDLTYVWSGPIRNPRRDTAG
jgi:hypothetical protein